MFISVSLTISPSILPSINLYLHSLPHLFPTPFLCSFLFLSIHPGSICPCIHFSLHSPILHIFVPYSPCPTIQPSFQLVISSPSYPITTSHYWVTTIGKFSELSVFFLIYPPNVAYCHEQHGVLPQFIIWSPHPQYPRMWLCLGRRFSRSNWSKMKSLDWS